MTENPNIKEENNSSDDESKKESSSTVIPDDNLNEEEELDFYDFLEAVSDKIDTIAHQSKTKKKNEFDLFKRNNFLFFLL